MHKPDRSRAPVRLVRAADRSGLLRGPDGRAFAAIIFDMGGTLLEFENVPWPVLYPTSVGSVFRRLARMHKCVPQFPDFFARFDVLLERRRRRIREQSREYRIGILLRDLFRPFDIPIAGSEMQRLNDAYYAPIRRQVTVYPDTVETVRTLKNAGFRIGLLSNTCFRARDHREELIRFGVWSTLDAAVFTSTGTFRKPHPMPFRLIAQRLHVPVKRCLFVGDRQYEDVQGAQNVGMTAVLIRRPHHPYKPGFTQSVEIDDLRRIPELLARVEPRRRSLVSS